MRGHPNLPAIYALAAAARPRPVTPFYPMLSATVQPEFSAVLVGVKTPGQAVSQAQRSLEHLLKGIARGSDGRTPAR